MSPFYRASVLVVVHWFMLILCRFLKMNFSTLKAGPTCPTGKRNWSLSILLPLKMLGADQNPRLQVGDLALKSLAKELGKEDKFQPTNVAVYFGEPGVTKEDPYFEGRGPKRTGCTFCGGCMLGCRFNSKNTLDKNYLYLAQQNGVTIQAESEVYDVLPIDHSNGKNGYRVYWKTSTKYWKKRGQSYRKSSNFLGRSDGNREVIAGT